MSETPTHEEFLSRYEEENQAMLEAYQATSCTVVRNSKGLVVQAHMTYPDGTSEMVHHTSARDVVGPVSMTSSTRSERTELPTGDGPPRPMISREGRVWPPPLS